MPLLHWKAVFATAFCVAGCSEAGLAQAPPPTILTIDLENRVEYFYDIADPSRFATDPGVPSRVTDKNFFHGISMSDVVAVNGQPTKGTQIISDQVLMLRPNPAPGQAIADFPASALSVLTWEFSKPDGTQIGTLVCVGVAGSTPVPPGSSLAFASGPIPIVGGTGAFLGARGLSGPGMSITATRSASITEDPSNRRNTPGGKGQSLIYLIPMERPEIVTASGSPTVFHSDFTPVTAAKPAKAGEVLIVKATGLGPTVPGVNPGQPFPADAIVQVNSPVAVTVNGQAADVINAIGWPGQFDTYRVDFRVPDGIPAGVAAIQLTAAWIAGSAVNIPTQ